MNRTYSFRAFLLGCSLFVLALALAPSQPVLGQGGGTPTFLPTNALNSRLLFVSTRDGNAEVYITNPDGSAQNNLTNNLANDTEPAWSPDAKQIAFVSDRDGNPQICVMKADGSDQRCLTDNSTPDKKPDPTLPRDYAPTWSPDGKAIAFASKRGDDTDIYAINADGTNLVNVTVHTGVDEDPSWSPNLRQIAFTSNRNGNFDICVMDASGFNQRCLTNNRTAGRKPDRTRPDARYPAWSPDSLQLAFSNTKDRNLEVYTMKADGTDQRDLTRRLAADDQSAWWLGGPILAFVSNRDGRRTIYTMGIDGSGQRRFIPVPRNKGENILPAWEPPPLDPNATPTETLTPTPTGTIRFTPEPTDTPTATFRPVRRTTRTPTPIPVTRPPYIPPPTLPPPILSASGTCSATDVQFQIVNTGGPMQVPYQYTIVTAITGVIGGPTSFQLPAGGGTRASATHDPIVPSIALVIQDNGGATVFTYEVPCP